MMKRRYLLFLPVLLLCLGCPPRQSQQAASTDPLVAFGQSFVDALRARKAEAIRPLLVTEADARSTMAAAGTPKEQQDKELATFQEAIARMQDNQRASYNIYLDATKGLGMEEAELEKVERERPPSDEKIDKTDLNIFFKAKGKHYMADVDDCVHTVRGWVMTGKFEVMEAPAGE